MLYRLEQLLTNTIRYSTIGSLFCPYYVRTQIPILVHAIKASILPCFDASAWMSVTVSTSSESKSWHRMDMHRRQANIRGLNNYLYCFGGSLL